MKAKATQAAKAICAVAPLSGSRYPSGLFRGPNFIGKVATPDLSVIGARPYSYYAQRLSVIDRI
jgi:hypothetical protein